MTTCPDENTLIAYAERRLDAAGQSAVEAHLDGCSACLAVACLVARGEMTGMRYWARGIRRATGVWLEY